MRDENKKIISKDYSQVIELDEVTLEDCLILLKNKNIYTIINDGRIINFVEE